MKKNLLSIMGSLYLDIYLWTINIWFFSDNTVLHLNKLYFSGQLPQFVSCCINSQLRSKILYWLTLHTKVKLHYCLICLSAFQYMEFSEKMQNIYLFSWFHFIVCIYSIINGFLAHSYLNKWTHEWTCEWKTPCLLNTFLSQCSTASLLTDNCIWWFMVTTYFCTYFIYTLLYQ